MSTESSPLFSKPKPTPTPGIFPGLEAFSADFERLTRIAEALLGPLPIEESIRALAESDGMTPARALLQLTRWGRGTMAPFLRVAPDGQLRVDLSTEQAGANRDLVRRVVQTHSTEKTEHGTADVTTLSVELFSAMAATKRVLEWHERYSAR